MARSFIEWYFAGPATSMLYRCGIGAVVAVEACCGRGGGTYISEEALISLPNKF